MLKLHKGFTRIYKDSRSVFREGGFNLRKFISNVPELQRFFDEDELSTSMSDSNSDCVEETYAKSLLGGNQTMNPKNQKVLGVRWNVSTDCLIFSVQDIVDVAEKAVTTKRRVMSIIGKFYDPIGFLSPVVIKFKVFFKELCLTNLEWDEELSGELLHKWLLSTYPTSCLENIITCKSYSSLSRLFSVTSHVIKFVQTLKRAVKKQDSDEDLPDSDQIQHIIKAEMMWIQEAQKELTKDQHFATWKKQFGLYCEGEVWRCGGRLQHADLSQSERNPIILPREHHLTELIVLRAHDKMYHNGTKETLTEIRSRFWIIKGRSLVKKLIHKCPICRRHEGPHYQIPPPPPLPGYRVSQQPPFESTGVDFAGPLHIHYPGNHETNKVWLCLFTCAVIRAVHLDLVPDMSAPSFVRCLKRFVARRGVPRRLISDNAQTYKCSEKMLKTMMKQHEVFQYLNNNKIQWIFNVERAPWWGGLFERMVKSTKRCLRKVIGRSKLYYDELLTILVDTLILAL